jgi:hypothetical protein
MENENGSTCEEQSQQHAHHFHVHKELEGQTVNSTHYCDFYSDCKKMCKDFSDFGDTRIGCCTMTTHLLILPFLPREFFNKKHMTVA